MVFCLRKYFALIDDELAATHFAADPPVHVVHVVTLERRVAGVVGMFRFIISVPILLCHVVLAGAQTQYVMETYGDGVHAFNRSEYQRARSQFDKAISNGASDPRVYYFRAVTHLQNGDQGSAEQDIHTGAAYELEGRGTYDIGRALERVQGPHRLEFEAMRREAKMALSGRTTSQPRAFGLPLPTDRPLADELPLQAPAIPDDPFSDDDDVASDASDLDLAEPSDTLQDEVGPEPADDPAMPEDAVEEAPLEEDPFGETPEADDDPFAEEAADSAAQGMDDAPADGDADDPFGDDPFG
jgi:hypothetical protein